MSESSNLISNLNEIMEEYAEREEEAVQATQAKIRQEEDRAKAREKVEQSVEETRKRKSKGLGIKVGLCSLER